MTTTIAEYAMQKEINMNDFQEYLERWDYIPALDCLKSTKEIWKGCYNLTLSEALKVWKRLYGGY